MTKREEKLLAEVALGEMLGNYMLSPEKEDMIDHWDVCVKYDVKAVPHHESVPHKNGMRWVEIRNVNGDIGWLAGKADFIAFDEGDYWIFVLRQKLYDHVMKHTSGQTSKEEFKRKPVPYKWHTRDGRNDLVTLVPVYDLIHLGRLFRKVPFQAPQQD
jgi:hypothetical protein